MISRFSKGLSELMLSGHVWIHKYPEAINGLLIVKLFSVHLVCHALLRSYAALPVISLTVLNTSSWEGTIFGVLVYVSLQMTRAYMLSAISEDATDIHRHEGCNAVYVLDLPMNWCVDDGNVTIDFRAVFKWVNVGGIDRQGVSHVSCSKSITHCTQLRKQISVQRLFSKLLTLL